MFPLYSAGLLRDDEEYSPDGIFLSKVWLSSNHEFMVEDIPSTTSDNLSALPSPASVEVSDTEPSCSTLLESSPTASTPDTSARLQGQLQAKLADKSDLFKFIQSQLRMQCRSSKGRRWSAKSSWILFESGEMSTICNPDTCVHGTRNSQKLEAGPRNQGLFKEMNVTSENPYFVYKKKKIFAMYDPPHLLKSLRNNLKNHGIYYEDTSIANTTRTAFASWKHIEQLYEMDYKNVLSHSEATALNLYILAHKIEENAKDTMNFVKNMDILFDSVNSVELS
ncbi:hypothetical protein AVEN_155363-1 [Araneus ventricosus]|uniref:Transposable element P transposase n=1 Tax=Araneus ventricosus TaxID=182803 RepID=A0A4Y2SB28_ARAVE|nr:hypothetical protein AVEN_155363-1 [Araneus ventricosus]